VLRSPATRVVALSKQQGVPQGDAQLLLDPGRDRAFLVTSALPTLAENQTYQLWLIGNNIPVSMGTFEVNQQGVATIVVQANRPLSEFQAVGVSVEPAGGSPQPTNVILLNQL
jgi:anti-sigma-K factor RskA